MYGHMDFVRVIFSWYPSALFYKAITRQWYGLLAHLLLGDGHKIGRGYV